MFKNKTKRSQSTAASVKVLRLSLGNVIMHTFGNQDTAQTTVALRVLTLQHFRRLNNIPQTTSFQKMELNFHNYVNSWLHRSAPSLLSLHFKCL